MAGIIAEMTQKIITTRVKEVPAKERVLEFIGTTEIPDRDGEVIKADAWQVDRYIKNPVVQWAHQYDKPPIGKTLSIRQNKKKETIFEIEFASSETYEFADTIYKLCREGYLNATSVGFIPIEYEKGKKESDASRIFTKVELLEISIVPVPSNPEALVTARNAGVITTKEFEAITKTEDKPKSKDKSPQTEIKDEIDYLSELCDKNTLNPENIESANTLITKLLRLTGSDIPDKDMKGSPPIKRLARKVVKAIDEHHMAHNKCNDTVMKYLKEMVDMPDGDIEPEEGDKAFEDAINKAIEEAIKKMEVE